MGRPAMTEAASIASDPAPKLLWRRHPLSDLHWRRWDDDWVVFDAGSGQTHRMDTLSAVVLLVLEDIESAGLAELGRHVADALEVAADPTLLAALDAVLQRQSIAGLVEPVVA